MGQARQVSRCLGSDFVEYQRQQAIIAVIWALYKKASGVLGIEDRRLATTWICRPCTKVFRSKGGLGAHFFKSHGRTGSYRAVVTGTVCKACGTQFWGTNRLSRHLRDSPECDATLRTHGIFADTVAPGIGSRGWRKNATEQFHPAVPTKQAPAIEPGHRLATYNYLGRCP